MLEVRRTGKSQPDSVGLDQLRAGNLYRDDSNDLLLVVTDSGEDKGLGAVVFYDNGASPPFFFSLDGYADDARFVLVEGNLVLED